MTVRCMPYGHDTMADDCPEEIPDVESQTMYRFGWDFTRARDDGAENGRGWFAACPEHADLDPEEREAARRRNARATGRDEDDRALELSVK